MFPEASGRRSSARVRTPAPLAARSTSRSAPASGRYRLSPLRARHTACVTVMRPPSGTARSTRATTARRTASRANARVPQSSWRSANLATGGPPRHSHHHPCRVPVGRAFGDGSRRGPCCCRTPSANDACCPRPASTSSAPRAPDRPARQFHSAPNALARSSPQSRVADAESARAGPLRAGSASERNATSPPRSRSESRVSPASPASAASARQRPRASMASSSDRAVASNPRLACRECRAASAPSEMEPCSRRAPTRSRFAKRPASTPPRGESNATPEPERPRNRARSPRSSASLAQGSAAPPSTRPRPQRGAMSPAANAPPANGALTRPPARSSAPSRSVPRVPPPRKLTRCDLRGAPPGWLTAPTATSSSCSASESAASSV